MSGLALSKKAIARDLGLEVKSVRKWLKVEWRRRRREKTEKELDRFLDFLAGPESVVRFQTGPGGQA